MNLPEVAPDGIDISRPSAARVYDYFLGGAHNFAIDRQLAEQIASMTPNIAETMRANRAFLRRGVRFLVGEGIRQFLDIGSGIPTVGNVHEVAQELAPESTVVYVDIDPVAVAHSRALLEGNDRCGVICADLREPDRILAEAASLGLIDFTKPVAVLLAGVIHFIPEADDPPTMAARLRAAVVPGSYLLISHATLDGQPQEVIEAQRLSARTATEIVLRSREEILPYFGDFELVDPGLVFIPAWRPEPGSQTEHPEMVGAYAGVARKL
jgi:SAM-dependent methyltransferase